MSERKFPFVVHPLGEVLKERPGFQLQWQGGEKGRVLFDPNHGEIRHVVVCDRETGKPLWDQPVYVEPVGAICVPVTTKGKIRLIKQFRPIVHPGGERILQKFPEILPKYYWGKIFLGVARGFPIKGESAKETAMRETSEEVNSPVLNVRKIGEVNANSSFFHHMISVFVVYIDENSEGDSSPDINEAIFKGADYTLEQVRQLIADNDIQDALDIAALSMYIQDFETSYK